MYYGFDTERMTVNGKTGSVLIPGEQAESVRIAFEMYQNPDVSCRDIINYFVENNIVTKRSNNRSNHHIGSMSQSHLSQILENPLYVRADKDVYAFFQTKGYVIEDDISSYDGVHGVFTHRDSDGNTFVKIGYHEGLVSAKQWLAVQDKKNHNQNFPNNSKAKRSWLIGLIKCPYCGYGIQINVQWNKNKTREWRYLVDYGYLTVKGCRKRTLQTKLDEVEEAVYMAMCDRIKSIEIAHIEEEKPDADTENFKSQILKYEDDIHKLMDKLPNADEVLFSYIQERVSELHKKKSELEHKLQSRTRKRKTVDAKPLSEPLRNWDNLSIESKHEIAVTMIDAVYVSDEDGIYIKFSV